MNTNSITYEHFWHVKKVGEKPVKYEQKKVHIIQLNRRQDFEWIFNLNRVVIWLL